MASLDEMKKEIETLRKRRDSMRERLAGERALLEQNMEKLRAQGASSVEEGVGIRDLLDGKIDAAREELEQKLAEIRGVLVG